MGKHDNLWKKAHGRRKIPAECHETLTTLLRIWHAQADAECQRLRRKLKAGMIEEHGEAYARWVNIRSWFHQQLQRGLTSVSDRDYLAAVAAKDGFQGTINDLPT